METVPVVVKDLGGNVKTVALPRTTTLGELLDVAGSVQVIVAETVRQKNCKNDVVNVVYDHYPKYVPG